MSVVDIPDDIKNKPMPGMTWGKFITAIVLTAVIVIEGMTIYTLEGRMDKRYQRTNKRIEAIEQYIESEMVK